MKPQKINNGNKLFPKIGIIAHHHIGDTILVEPIVRVFKQSGFPVFLFVKSESAAEITKLFFSPSHVTVFNGLNHLKRLLSYHQIDVVYVLDRSLGTALTSFRAGIALRFGVGTEGRWLFLTEKIKCQKKEHHGQTHRRVFEISLKKLSAKYSIKNLKLVWDQADIFPKFHPSNTLNSLTPILFPPGPYLLVHLGTTRPAKNIPLATYERLIKKKLSKFSHILLCGDDKEMEKKLMPLITESYVGRTDLGDFCSLIQKAGEVISPDTSAMHIASAYGVKVQAVFGSTDPKLTGPLNPKAEVLFAKVSCSPCFRQVCKFKTTDKRWMQCMSALE